MRKRKLSFRPLAADDLAAVYTYIADSSTPAIARTYLDRIEAACRRLEAFPYLGTRRDDIRRGLRIISFERRVAIAYYLTKTEVVIVRIFYGGRDYEAALRRPSRLRRGKAKTRRSHNPKRRD